jgi:hypothetical protein
MGPMTIVEFVHPVKGSSHRNKVLSAVYFAMRYEQSDAVTVDDIRTMLKRARISGVGKINIPDVLNKSGNYVDSPGVEKYRRLWRLTSSGEAYVRELLGLPEPEPEIEHDIATLSRLSANITDDAIRRYVDEALKCLQVGALRAAVVFLWAGAIRVLQEKAIAVGGAKVAAAVNKHDPKARPVAKVDDFSFVKEKTALLAFGELGMLDKSQRGVLEDALNLRNRCGHPTKYEPGVKRVSSFIEDVVGVVF